MRIKQFPGNLLMRCCFKIAMLKYILGSSEDIPIEVGPWDSSLYRITRRDLHAFSRTDLVTPLILSNSYH